MRLTVALVVYEGIEPALLDDPERMRACLQAGVEAGGFTLMDLRVVRFSPVGVTAAAIVGESHLAVHTWPEEGRLFVDVASCGEPAGVGRAVEALVSLLPGARLVEKKDVTMGAGGS